MKRQETKHGHLVNYSLTQGHQARAALCNFITSHYVYLTLKSQAGLPDVFVNKT